MPELKAKLNKLYSIINLWDTIIMIWEISPTRTILSILFLILENACWLGTIYSLKLLIDKLVKAVGKPNSTVVMYYVFIAGVLAVLYACIKSLSSYFNDVHAAKVNHTIDEKIHLHTINLDFGYYEDPEYLNILKRAREAGVDRPFAVVSSLLEIGKNFAMILSLGYILIRINWNLVPLLAAFVFPILIVRLKFSDRMYNLQRENTGLDREASYLSFLITGDSSAKEIRAFTLGTYLLNKYLLIKKKLLNQQLGLNKRRTIIELLTTILATSAFFAVMAYLIFGTLNGTTSVGDIAVFLVVFPQSFSTMQGMISSITRLYQNNIYMADIFELFNLKSKIEVNKDMVFAHNDNEIKDIIIDSVWFKYPHATETVLENINLKIPSGKIVALVGLNGAGKSTLIKLLCRLYDPINGAILFDDNDIRNLNVADYRSQVSVVFQDFVKYNRTVTENIWFGDIKKEVTDKDITLAAESSGAAHFIEQFPARYETMLGRVFEEGYEISIGQWQMLAIARAFYSNSKLVILDEVTSALDAVSENELFKTIKERLGNRSALVISHRLSTIKHADFIYVMADKNIVESGTHETLISQNGRYSDIYRTDNV